MERSRKLILYGKKFVKKLKKDGVRAYAAESAFFMIMSFFPVLMLLLTLIRYTPFHQQQILYALEELTPFEVLNVLEPMVDSIYSGSFALVPWTAFAAVWASGKGIMGISDGLNFIYRIDETKNYVMIRIRAACYTVVMILALIVSLGVLVFGYGIQDYLRKNVPFVREYPQSVWLWPLVCALLILVLLFLIMYMFLPNRRMKAKSQLPGAIFTAIAWAVFSYAFSIYLEFAVNMSVIYGSLTTLVVAMLWLYCCMYLFFAGAEINHSLDMDCGGELN